MGLLIDNLDREMPDCMPKVPNCMRARWLIVCRFSLIVLEAPPQLVNYKTRIRTPSDKKPRLSFLLRHRRNLRVWIQEIIDFQKGVICRSIRCPGEKGRTIHEPTTPLPPKKWIGPHLSPLRCLPQGMTGEALGGYLNLRHNGTAPPPGARQGGSPQGHPNMDKLNIFWLIFAARFGPKVGYFGPPNCSCSLLDFVGNCK